MSVNENSKVEVNENQDTVVVFTYRYMWKNTDGKLCVKFVTDTLGGLKAFEDMLKAESSVVSAIKEYVSEVNFAFLGFTETVKAENKEKGENEDEKA